MYTEAKLPQNAHTHTMPTVAIVGRPNVGKSTLFNRLTEERDAIVDDAPGVTRDRIYGEVHWNGRDFDLIDTGGFVPRSADKYEAAIREQVHVALEEADAVLLVVDVTTGITSIDEEVATLLRRDAKPVLVVANKADNEERRWEASSFYALGFEEVFPISATSGSGTGDLLDALVDMLPEKPKEARPEITKIAIIGRPNVGKSSLVNKLLGSERSIVTDAAGTTRDAVNTLMTVDDRQVMLVDTAGLRKRTKVKENVEFYATLRTERALKRGDVAVLLIEALEGLQAQDIKVLKKAEEMKKGLVIAVNKWDMAVKEEDLMQRYEDYVAARLPSMTYIPLVFTSALTGKRVDQVLTTAMQVADERRRKISTSSLNDVLQEATHANPPPSYRGGFVQIKYATQIRVAPPVFAFFCNHPKGITEPYRRYLERKLREAFGYTGVPLTLEFRQK